MNIRKASAILLTALNMSAFADPLSATDDAAANTAAIQSAIDAAAIAATPGMVTLGEGVFEINAELMVTGGVQLVGQGWEKTTIRQTKTDGVARCMTIGGGAEVTGLTLTGGRTHGDWNGGAGAMIENGTLSYCRVTGNQTGDLSWQGVSGKQMNGGGVYIKQGTIEHCEIFQNTVCSNGGGESLGGAIYIREPTGPVTIDTCLIYGNRAPNGKGGAIAAELGNYHEAVAIRNSTIADNSASGEGGAVYFQENGNSCSLSFVDCVIANNSGSSADTLIKLVTYSDAAQFKASCEANSSGNVLDNGVSLGAKSTTVSGSGAGWFADPANGDYTPVAGSPAVGKGYNAGDIPPPPPVDPESDPVFTLMIPAKTGLAVSSVMTNDVPVVGANNAYLIVSNTAVSITFAANSGYEITGGANPVVVTVEANMTLADSLYPTVQKKQSPTGQIEPGETAAETRQTIQDAVDLAATDSPAGTVTLAEGEFTIDAELMVTGGVKLVGQGWDKTVLKQTTSGQRVVTVGENSKLQGVTVTGGKIDETWTYGAGVFVDGGMVSFCRVTENSSTGTGAGGVGVGLAKGSVDHCIIDNNKSTGASTVGGGIGMDKPTAEVFVDACLIYGNFAKNGGGIGAVFDGVHNLLTVRNTTIANNVAGENGCALYERQHNDNKHFDLKLVNCVLADNVSGDVDAVVITSYSGDAAAAAARTGCEAQSSGNVLDNGATFGANSTTVSGSGADWFVDAENNDYHLAEGAAPIAAGVVYDGLDTDLDGIAFKDETPSAGCYEFGGPVVEKKGVIFSIW